MSVSDIDVLYSPTSWSKRLPKDVIILEHIKKTTEASQETQKSIPHQLNVKYGPEKEHVYDIFGTDLDGRAPIFVFIHGGYWQEPSILKELYWFVAKNLHENGIKTIFIEYELCPKVSLSTISKNIRTALTEVVKYAEDSKSTGIYLSGHSAGAHLAVQLFENFIPNLPIQTRTLFKSVFMICGIYDLVPLIQTTINEPLKLDEQRAVESSPMRQQLTGGETIFYVIAAQNDGPPFVEQAKQMEGHLVKCGAKTEYIFLEDIDHFDIVENLFDNEFKLTKFIIEKIHESI